MLTFEKAYEFTKTIGSHTSFEEEECRAYFDLLMTLPVDSQIVEVGLEYGRSSSIALQVAKDRGLRYMGIELNPRQEWFDKLSKIVDSLKVCYAGFFGFESSKIPISEQIDAILIDGDHSYEGVKVDCEHFLPHVRTGGFALFHDYKRESLPEVTKAVDEYMLNGGWAQMETVGTLGCWRKR